MLLPLIFAFAAAAAAPASATTPTTTPSTTPTTAAAVDSKRDVALLSSLVTAGLADHDGVDVLSAADVRRQLELEGDRQVLGCESDTNCLAELADAMGTRLVVTGTVGQLGSDFMLTLTVFDSSTGTSPSRVVLRDKTIERLSEQIPDACTRLLSKALPTSSATRTKLLVLELEGDVVAPKTTAAVVVDDGGFPVGGVVTGTGVIVGLVGGGFLVVSGIVGQTADDPKTTQRAALAAYEQRELLGWVGVVGVSLGVVTTGVGIALIAVGE